MGIIPRLLVLVVVAWSASVTLARAQHLDCDGVAQGAYAGVSVASGAICALDGATVAGDVTVERGGALNVINGSRIDGNVVTTGALFVAFADNARIDGDVIIRDTEESVNICFTDIGGDLYLVDNLSSVRVGCRLPTRVGGNVKANGNAFNDKRPKGDGVFAFRYLRVDGSVMFVDNTIRSRAESVFYRNRIGGNLGCESNRPAPTGETNSIAGRARGQCWHF